MVAAPPPAALVSLAVVVTAAVERPLVEAVALMQDWEEPAWTTMGEE